MQLVHSPFGDNNLVPFYFWWTEIVIKCGKAYKYFFHDCIKKAIPGKFCNIHRKTIVEVTYVGVSPVTLIERDSNTCAFLWILENF